MNSDPLLRAIFNEALDRQDAVARARYLDEACGADAALRERVERLLRADEEAGGFFSDPNSRPQSFNPPPSTLILPVTEKAGERIGRYKLREKIGEGGCGVVYVAEQEEPVRRRVALKVIKLGMDTQQVIARFGAERQALAMMDHPNIAKVLDAGATDTGRPYFVMELVKGIRITDYCDQNNLSTEDRLGLFNQVCRAIQHAHQKGIIHRDIKPSNILVTLHDGVPVPKVIDFGIAKATEGRLTDLTVYTELHQFIGTPAYMSPEQAEMSGLDIDTRSDIYALGVLLYELLTGQTPFDPKELIAAGLDEMRRTIREKEPTRPSTCLSTMLGADLTEVAKHRQAEPARLASLIRGDLDWIVMKALEKDRNRRYETANGLAADIQRHLQNEPVMARAPTNLYRFQKLIRRNKLAFAAISAVTLALLMGLAATTWIFFKEKAARQRAVAAEQAQSHLREAAQKSQANEVKLRQQAEANEKKAQTEASKSTQVAQFLKDMLSGVGPSVALGRDTRMLREILDKTAGRIGNDLKKQPDVEAELRNILGVVYRDLGEYEKAKAMHRQALALQKSLLGDNDAAVARTLNSLGSMLTVEGKLAEAEVVLREALVIRRKLFGNDGRELGEALDNLGSALCFQPGKSAEAATLIYEGLAIRKKAHGSEDPMIAFSLDNVGRVLQAQGKLAEAEAAWREAWMLRKKQLGEEHVLVANSLFYLANVLNSQGKLQEAEARQRESLQLYRKLLGNDDRRVDMALYHLAVILEEQGKLAEAEGVWREELAIEKKLSGDESPFVANSLMALSGVLKRQNKLVEAEAVIREALAMRKKLLGNEHPDVAATLENLSAFLLEQGRLAEAQTAQSEAVAIRSKTPAAPAR